LPVGPLVADHVAHGAVASGARAERRRVESLPVSLRRAVPCQLRCHCPFATWEFTEAMNDVSSTRLPDEGGIDRKALWVVRELGLPAIVRACVSCRSTRHHPTGKFRVNASGKLLDVWMLISCELCDRTSKIPIHERIHVQALDHDRLLRFENNNPAMVRQLTMDAALAGKNAYQLDWSGTWELDTDLPFYDLEGVDAAPLEVVIRFELPAPIRIGKLLTAGFGLSRSAVQRMVDSGRIRLPMPVDAKAREDFTFFVLTDSAG
jgi:hypothetical protein